MALTNETAWDLVQRFPRIASAERELLLAWARETPLAYGTWKPFKKLFKTLDTAAKSGADFDIELLAALIARIDQHVPEQATAHLVLNPDAPEPAGNVRDTRSATHVFKVGKRSTNDWNGLRLSIAPLAEPRNFLQKIGLGAPSKSTAHQTWDLKARGQVPHVGKVELRGSVLTVSSMHTNQPEGEKILIDVADVAYPTILGDEPSRATWGYMKRRARRLLRELQPGPAYWPLLRATLRAGGPDSFHPAWQWALTDALLGGGPRLAQRQRGRGIVEFNSSYWNHRREERAPAAWDGHRDEVRALIGDETVPVAANAVALNAWRARENIASLLAPVSTRQLERFLNSDVPWLRAVAGHEALRRWQGGTLPSGGLAALLAVAAGGRTRNLARALLEAMPPADAAWQKEFAAPLLQWLDNAGAGAADARRTRNAALLLAVRARDGISYEAFWEHLGLWISLENELGSSFSAWLDTHLVSAGKNEFRRKEHLAALAGLNLADRDRALQAFVREAGSHKPDKDQALALVTTQDREADETGWRYLAATAVDTKTLLAVWKHFFDQYASSADYEAAFGDYAAPLFGCLTFTEEQTAKLWGEGREPLYRQAWFRITPNASPGFVRVWLAVSSTEAAPGRIFKTLSFLKPDTSNAILSELIPYATGFEPVEDDIRAALLPTRYFLTVQDGTAALAFLAASRVTKETLRAVWKELFAVNYTTGAAPSLIELLRRAELSADEIGAWLPAQFGRIQQFPPDFLAALLQRSPYALLDGMLRAGESQLPALRVLLHKQLGDAAFRASFWSALWPLLRDAAQSETIEKNLLSDGAVARAFTDLDEVGEFFATDEPAHESFLVAWLDAHLGRLGRDDLALLQAAICPLSGVHRRALERVRALGLTLSLALRLLESQLPPAMALAREWFEGATHADEADYALALCDSPNAAVQKIGREFILARAQRLLDGALLRRLAEGTSPAMQAWVAAQLKIQEKPVDTVEFDRAVLRTRGRARRAKELVKARLGSSEQPVAPATLLELARGRTARDREWALQQLAKQALAGETIEGVELK